MHEHAEHSVHPQTMVQTEILPPPYMCFWLTGPVMGVLSPVSVVTPRTFAAAGLGRAV